MLQLPCTSRHLLRPFLFVHQLFSSGSISISYGGQLYNHLLPRMASAVVNILLTSIMAGACCLVTVTSSSNSSSKDLTYGFESLPLRRRNLRILKPYNLPVDQRYSFINGVHKCWVYSTDKPHSRHSKTLPRTEIGIHGYGYRTGVWQFEGYAYVPEGTSGVCIMQVFGAGPPPSASTAMVRVYDGKLYYYRRTVLAENIYGRWFRLNVIHDVAASKVWIYVDGVLKLEADGRGGTVHTFKCGVYAQKRESYYMESRWKYLKVLRKV